MNEPELASEPRMSAPAKAGLVSKAEEAAGQRSHTFESALGRYLPVADVYDEAVLSDGRPRPTWEPLFKELGSLSLTELSRRLAGAQRQLKLDGVAFNPHDADGGVSRPWSIDAIPLLIGQSEWDTIAAGLEQRARVADLILLDLLGPQTLLHERILPPAVLFGDPNYSPAFHSLIPRPKKHLHLYSADLARSPDGSIWVTADRCRSPLGLGYILENRLLTSRMLPGAFRSCNVQRLAPFFIALTKALHDIAPRNRDNPRIAIWTKGPRSRSYFEDAFLARYLGYILVEGEDLAVRGNQVKLKTLGGLLPVEVLLRRIEDHHSDPAELTSDTTYGVPGILEVIRAGNVSVCNSVGSSLIESPMLMAFLPNVCRHLLAEDLVLPSVATWWCGDPEAFKFVTENLDQLIIRSAFRTEEDAPVLAGRLSSDAKNDLLAQIKATPEMFVAQECVQRSTTPVWQEQQLKPWSVALRAFLVSDADGYQTLPGALARVSPNQDVFAHNMTSGEKSQDVWIAAEEPVSTVSLLKISGKDVELKRGGAELPSRVADNLFWLGRNLERTEQLARLVRFTLEQLTSEEATATGAMSLVDACRTNGLIEKEGMSDDLDLLARHLSATVVDRNQPQSLWSTVDITHGIASKVRDRVALDAYRVLTELRELMDRDLVDRENAPIDVTSMMNGAITLLSAISGLAGESVTRTQGWRFLDLGRRIERAFHTARLIRDLLPLQPDDHADIGRALENCLQICDSFMTYRSRYFADVQPAAVLDLLITDDTNPRSILFQLEAIHRHVDLLPRSETQAEISPEQRIALSQFNAVRLTDLSKLASQDSRGEFSTLHRLLTRLIEQLPRLTDTVSGKFLIHAGLQRHFAAAYPGADKPVK